MNRHLRNLAMQLRIKVDENMGLGLGLPLLTEPRSWVFIKFVPVTRFSEYFTAGPGCASPASSPVSTQPLRRLTRTRHLCSDNT